MAKREGLNGDRGRELRSALSLTVIEEFCKLCDWTHEVWLNHRLLFDDNPRAEELAGSFAGRELERLSKISQEYSLLQIKKLHDPAIMQGKATLGINYVLQFGNWPTSLDEELKDKAAKLELFASYLKDARNKTLAHNDLMAILKGDPLGAFPENDELAYFETLQEFVNLVHGEAVGGLFPFNTLVKNDVTVFLEAIRPAGAREQISN